MLIAFPKEGVIGENRCAFLPSNVKAYQLMGVDVSVEAGLGVNVDTSDADYAEAGVEVINDRKTLLEKADIVVSIGKLPQADLSLVKGKVVISFLDPFNDEQYVKALCDNGVTAFSMEMIPRSTRCQKMDALSSQASLAGYVMVAKAMNELKTIFPMMMTAAGTIKPAKVFIIGAGVAGLQAIATAKRLGAQVTAFDTRPEVAEQVKSLGAKFLEIDLGDTGATEQGYAKELTPEQIAIQQAAQAKCIAESDIVITTAQLFGRKPPRLINAETVSSMKPGSVIVDMAAETGGNVEGTVAGEIVNVNGVKIIGTGNWAGEVALNASQMYATNVLNVISEFWQKEQGTFTIDVTDEIQERAVITHAGQISNESIKALYPNIGASQVKEEAAVQAEETLEAVEA